MISVPRERPILFSGPMVRAILQGRKTVTRRPVKGDQVPRLEYLENPEPWVAVGQHHPRYGFVVYGKTEEECAAKVGELGACPYGKAGDRLWVRETWLEDPEDDGTWAYSQYMGCKGSPLSDIPKRFQNPDHCIFRAGWNGSGLRWRPSIHMPRWASRILLEITDVRVERLQNITPAQAVAEGVDGEICREHLETSPVRHLCREAEILGFAGLWNSTGGDWDANPWVWVVEFKRVTS
ncbi:hypothetical protein I5P85_18820 [Pseudomonas putida]|nr:hypothetical protein [Pseudomonas putida]